MTAAKEPKGPGLPLHLKDTEGVPVVVQGIPNPTKNHEVAGSTPWPQWVKDLALL